MADLPPDRAEIVPPFYQRGFDVFGPWTVQARRTRGGVAVNKRWVVVFTCLVSTAIHIELLETVLLHKRTSLKAEMRPMQQFRRSKDRVR